VDGARSPARGLGSRLVVVSLEGLVAAEAGRSSPGSVVCGVESGPGSPAVSVAKQLAARLRLRLIAVHACDPSSRIALGCPAPVAEDPAEEDVRRGWKVLARTVDELGDRAEGRLVFDHPARALRIVATRSQSRFIVVGYRDPGLVRSRLCRPVWMQLAAAAARPVVVVPSGQSPCG
jgi:hypothetical protein